MRSLLPLAVYCISLVSLQQLRALAAEERPDTHRLDLLNKLFDEREEATDDLTLDSQAQATFPSSAASHYPKWLQGFLGSKPASGVRARLPSPPGSRPPLKLSEQRERRVRRHAHSGSRGGHQHQQHNAQLMRVGCVLGTCQVQNLSHRLYQLIGQSGREDSSPINPRSPHSYG